MITATGEKDAADHTFGSRASIRLCRLRPVYPLTANAPTSVGDDWYGPRACKNSILSHTTWAITGPLEHLRLRPTISSGSCLHRPPSHGHELRAPRIGGTVNLVVAKPGPAGAIKQRGPVRERCRAVRMHAGDLDLVGRARADVSGQRHGRKTRITVSCPRCERAVHFSRS